MEPSGTAVRARPATATATTSTATATSAVRARAATAGAVRPVHRAGVARQAALARRAYAVTVLRALARTQQGRPVAQVRRLVKDALTPLGVRLTPDQYQQLAGDLTAGRTVTLP